MVEGGGHSEITVVGRTGSDALGDSRTADQIRRK